MPLCIYVRDRQDIFPTPLFDLKQALVVKMCLADELCNTMLQSGETVLAGTTHSLSGQVLLMAEISIEATCCHRVPTRPRECYAIITNSGRDYRILKSRIRDEVETQLTKAPHQEVAMIEGP